MRLVNPDGREPLKLDGLYLPDFEPRACICNRPSDNFTDARNLGGGYHCSACSGSCADGNEDNHTANLDKAEVRQTTN